MADEKPISRFAQRFVARKLEEIRNQAFAGSDGRHEFENNFVDGVLELADRTKRADLRRHLMQEATNTSEYLRQVQDAMTGEVRKIVWNGPWVETDEGRTIRGSVGQTYGGQYRSAEVSLYEEHGPTGRVAFSRETSEWNNKRYAHKEQAIFAARETVQRSVERDRHTQKPGEIVDARVDARALAIAERRRSKAAESLREHDRMTAQAGQGEKSSPYQAGTELDGNYTTQEARDRAAHVPGLHERQGAAEKYGSKDSGVHELHPKRRSR